MRAMPPPEVPNRYQPAAKHVEHIQQNFCYSIWQGPDSGFFSVTNGGPLSLNNTPQIPPHPYLGATSVQNPYPDSNGLHDPIFDPYGDPMQSVTDAECAAVARRWQENFDQEFLLQQHISQDYKRMKMIHANIQQQNRGVTTGNLTAPRRIIVLVNGINSSNAVPYSTSAIYNGPNTTYYSHAARLLGSIYNSLSTTNHSHTIREAQTLIRQQQGRYMQRYDNEQRNVSPITEHHHPAPSQSGQPILDPSSSLFELPGGEKWILKDTYKRFQQDPMLGEGSDPECHTTDQKELKKTRSAINELIMQHIMEGPPTPELEEVF